MAYGLPPFARMISSPARTLAEQSTAAAPSASTAEERLAMVWQLALDAWALTGRAIPDYPRREAPGRVIRAAEKRTDSSAR